MADWKENKIVVAATAMVVLFSLIFYLFSINRQIQEKRRRVQEFDKWNGAPQAGRLPK